MRLQQMEKLVRIIPRDNGDACIRIPRGNLHDEPDSKRAMPIYHRVGALRNPKLSQKLNLYPDSFKSVLCENITKASKRVFKITSNRYTETSSLADLRTFPMMVLRFVSCQALFRHKSNWNIEKVSTSLRYSTYIR